MFFLCHYFSVGDRNKRITVKKITVTENTTDVMCSDRLTLIFKLLLEILNCNKIN